MDHLVEEPLWLAVATTHHVARCEAVALADLADEPFVMFERALAPALYEDILRSCLRAGFSMRVVHHAPQRISAMMLAASGGGVTLVPSSLAGLQQEPLCMIPLQGPQPVAAIALATRRDDTGMLPARFRTFALAR